MNYLKYIDIIKNNTLHKCVLGGIIVFSLVTGIGYLVKNEILHYSKEAYDNTESEIIQNIPENTRVNDEEKDTRVNDEEKDTRDKLDCNVDEYMRELTDDEELLDIVKLMEIDV